ncbi:tRNA (adenosine(37)-N6)-threonylcarbamoyltransferase complex dimerization subunit type 1 TsaB [Desulfovibrio sulfodismutans]|uniref:tRNA (Adenosine(37)-N6)-threonylcarbamoyltransferase complex dimerization subunit type 1 TsaB n=1 Tax=Desulfolutivibrio sulfodismutans TaxID=63561 RepID=A0A7K3NMF4_9BACT|nr:tRNA (adenosine(37)-N6)-threonylcarbamoyltransferase complex dimerization subunit type 1 TsaB [Desulfolutivibrio sulfodismutans]NDY57370.1 tRNA (adenosine(37)-N6)-threonylcarbamoyltransferase complex dimerization subunit type 1 TsaB [Desulfolutivibrio sulfodismutans]
MSDLPGPVAGPTLVLCAVEEVLRVVLAEAGRVREAFSAKGQGVAMTFLVPAMAEALSRAGMSPAGLAGVACVCGPGSFTGIRVSLAVAEGLRLGTGIPLWGLAYPPLVARAAFALRPGAKRVAAVVHARKGLTYVQAFTARAGQAPSPVGPVRVLPAPLAAQAAWESFFPPDGEGAFEDAAVVGSGLRNNREAFAAVFPEACLLSDEAAFPDADILAAAATGPARDAVLPPDPIYQRPSDAEENLADISRRRGLDPDRAKALLAAAMASGVA